MEDVRDYVLPEDQTVEIYPGGIFITNKGIGYDKEVLINVKLHPDFLERILKND